MYVESDHYFESLEEKRTVDKEFWNNKESAYNTLKEIKKIKIHLDFIKTIEMQLNKKAKLNFLPKQPGDVNNTKANCKKLNELIDFKPTINSDFITSIFILSISKRFLSFPFSILPEGNFSV